MKTNQKRAHSNELNSFDLLWAVTQDAVNTQLKYMFGFGFIESNVSMGKIETDGFEIKGKLNAPEIHFDSNSVSQANMILSFASGTYTSYQGFGPSATKETVSCEGWTIGMTVDLKAAAIENNKNSSMDEALKILQTKGFLDTAIFSVRHIFLDFQNVNMSSFDDSKLVIKGEIKNIEQVKAQFKIAFSTYFGQIKNSDNPYVLGYSVENNETPQGDLEKVLFAPTGVAYSTHNNPSHAGKSTLNFLMMTGGDPVSLDQRDIIIQDDIVGKSGTDGIAVIRKSIFEEQYLSIIWSAIVEKLMPVDPTTLGIKVSRYDTNSVINKYNQTPSGAKQFGFDSDIATYADLGGYKKIHYINRQSINMNLTTGSDFIEFSGKGKLFTEVLFKQFIGTWTPWGGKGEEYVGQFWSIINSDLSISIKMTAGKDGKIGIESNVNFAKGKYDTGHSGVYGEISNIFADLGIGDHIENNLHDFNTEITTKLQSIIGTINGSFETLKDRIIVPGSKEFSYKNIQLTKEGNVQIDTTYNLEDN